MTAVRPAAPLAALAVLTSCLLGGVGGVASGTGALAFGAEPPPAGADGARAGEEQTAEEHEHHRPVIHAKDLALQLFNFAVLLFILIKFGGSAVNKALLARHQQLKTELRAAAEARAAAEQRLAKQEARLASLEQEMAAIRAGIEQEAEAEKALLLAASEERARRIREETAFMLEQQVKEAEGRLRREVAEVAVKVAEELVRRSLDGRDQQRLIDMFVGEVAAGNGASGGPAHRADGAGADGDHSRPVPTPRSEV